jgi:anaerobic dimethyl sulfoxide reductase subunit B
MTQMGIYFDQELCINCRACVVACKDWHDIPAGPVSYIHLTTVEKGKYPIVSQHTMFTICYNCDTPVCIDSCGAEAITKEPRFGIVRIDATACTSCRNCASACPYGIPQFGPDEDAKAEFCDLCYDRLIEGEQPICVDACIMHALAVGPIEELRAKYGDMRQAEGFAYEKSVAPNITLKPKVDKLGLPIQKIWVSPMRQMFGRGKLSP